MIRRLCICRSGGTDPYENLALEDALLSRVETGELILYLWQNERTVVIGRNQNPWKECRTALLTQEGGRLARRLSGGGAVYHDLGNLNFTFLTAAQDYDLPRQLSVLDSACRAIGVPVERSGRNDLLAGGRKFSGNAFYSHAGKAYHHGTLMVDVDLASVQRYLSPSRAKLAAKGVDSVHARVCNLREYVPDLTVERLVAALETALASVYGITPEPLRADLRDAEALREKYRSDAWLYGPKLPFTLCCEDRFPWGGIELHLQIEGGVVRSAQVYTDAMDHTLAARLEAALRGLAFRPAAVEAALDGLEPSVRQDLQSLFTSVM